MGKTQLKKKYFCLMVSFADIKQYINQKKYFIDKISNSFDEFYLINSEKLEYLSKKKEIDLKEIKKLLPTNCKVFDPVNSSEFLNFCENKDLVILGNIGRLWRHFRIHYLLKKSQSKLIYVQNLGNYQTTAYPKLRSFVLQLLLKHLPHKITIILSILRIFPMIDLRFLSDKFNYEKAINNFFFKISNKNKYINFFYTKEFVLVNSLAHDVSMSNELTISEEKIVMVDTNVNHKDNKLYSGILPEDKVKMIYKSLEDFLKKISKIYSKPVVVCVHPSQNIDKIKEYLKDFEVVKYKTKENIYKSFLTFFYDTSAIVDAFLLKKRIIVLENEMMGKSLTVLCNMYPKKTGIIKINLNEKLDISDKDLFLSKVQETTKSNKFNKFVNNNLQSDGDHNGTEKTIKIIKSKFFY